MNETRSLEGLGTAWAWDKSVRHSDGRAAWVVVVGRKAYRIAPDTYEPGVLRLDEWDMFAWCAANATHYRKPERAAADAVRLYRKWIEKEERDRPWLAKARALASAEEAA
mgnify:CR=1 FL=1